MSLKKFHQNLPAIQHSKFTHWIINISIWSTHILWITLWTFCWTIWDLICCILCPLLWHTERNWHFKHVLATIAAPHFACTRIQSSIRSTCGSCYAPTWFTTISCTLTMLATRTYNTLSTCEEFHLARGVVDIAIGCTYRSILGCTVTINGTRFTDGTDVGAWTNVSKGYGMVSNTACLDTEHAAIQVGSAISAAHEVFLCWAFVGAVWTFWSFATLPVFLLEKLAIIMICF